MPSDSPHERTAHKPEEKKLNKLPKDEEAILLMNFVSTPSLMRALVV